MDYKVTKFEWYTQLYCLVTPSKFRCFGLQSYKIWVIYTTHFAIVTCKVGCFGLQSYKIWVIYTTVCHSSSNCWLLFWITKLQNLSDIHNVQARATEVVEVVLDYKVTKFEWYTQPAIQDATTLACCFGLQSYKIWVIYTTWLRLVTYSSLLFWITKLQNLSDIHNIPLKIVLRYPVVLDYKVTKFEWYTQRTLNAVSPLICCFGLQSYKIWVIYTTSIVVQTSDGVLFWITKLQNLSDIHNENIATYSALLVVLDYKVTKFEWYTQLLTAAAHAVPCCFGLQSYKIWVIYTTRTYE